MHIIFVTPEFVTEEATYDGGLSNYLFKIARLLKEHGHQVSVLVIKNSADEEFTHEGINVLRVNVRSKMISAIEKLTFGRLSPALRWIFQSYRLNRRLKSYLKTLEGPYIVQYSSYTVPSLLRPKSVPSVVRVSGYQADILLNDGGTKKSLAYHQIKFLEDLMFRRAQKVFGPSRLVADLIKKNTGKDVTLIRTPFVPREISSLRIGENHLLFQKKYFLFFGSISPLKGILEISEIIRDLFTLYPETNFVFVGKDTTQLIDHVRTLAKEFSDKVIYLGKLKPEDLYPVIYNSRRVILPSRFDNLPNTCLEAMALGKIVIGTRGASFDEMIQEGVNGFLCDRFDSSSLLDAIKRSMSLSSTEEARICEKAKTITQDFSSEKVLNQLLELYFMTGNI
jgi:glycogen synthase